MATTPASAFARHGWSGRRVGIEPVAELEPRVPETVRRQQRRRRGGRGRHRVVLRLEHRRGRRRPATAPTAPTPRRRPRSAVVPARDRLRQDSSNLRMSGITNGTRPPACRLLGREVEEPVLRGTPARRRGRPPSVRTRRGRPSSRAARRAAGSRWGRRGSCPRSPHTTLRWSWLTSSSEHSNVPVRSQFGVDDHRLDGVGAELAGPALDLGVAEAVEGDRRLELVVAAAEDEPVGRLRRPQRADAELIVLRAPRRVAP